MKKIEKIVIPVGTEFIFFNNNKIRRKIIKEEKTIYIGDKKENCMSKEELFKQLYSTRTTFMVETLCWNIMGVIAKTKTKLFYIYNKEKNDFDLYTATSFGKLHPLKWEDMGTIWKIVETIKGE